MRKACRVRVFDAELVPQVAPTVRVFAVVVLRVTVASAVAGTGTSSAYVLTAVPNLALPWDMAVPVEPMVRMTVLTSICHGTLVTVEPWVIAPVAANAVPATPP